MHVLHVLLYIVVPLETEQYEEASSGRRKREGNGCGKKKNWVTAQFLGTDVVTLVIPPGLVRGMFFLFYGRLKLIN